MTTSETDPGYERSCVVREALRRYLKETQNMFEMDGTGQNRAGSTWWVRHAFNGDAPKPASMVAPVTFSDAGSEPEPLHLPALSLPQDVMTCLGDRDRMHIAELIRMLAVGNVRYAGVGVSVLCAALDKAGIKTDSVTIGATTRLGVRRDAVVAGLDAEADAEAARIVQDAHAVAVTAQPAAPGTAARLRDMIIQFQDTAGAILAENAALVAENSRLAAENQQLRMQPVSDDVLNKAYAGLKKQVDELTFQLRAARAVRR